MRALGVCLALLAVAGSARAESAAEQQFRVAMRHYGAADYDHAARAFARAYRLEQVPKYLFGWAQSERQRGRCDTALALFEEFLTIAPTPQDAVAARQAMKRCQVTPGVVNASVDEPAPSAAPAPRHRPSTSTFTSTPTTSIKGRMQPRSAFRWAVGGRVDVDPVHRGAVAAPCVALGFRYVEAFGNALLGGNQGVEVGARLARPGPRWSPFVSLSMPVFFIEGARVGARGSVGLRLHIGQGWAVTAEAGGSSLAAPPPGLSRNAGLLSLAVEVWN